MAATTDTARLNTDPSYEPTLEEYNQLLVRMGEAYKRELSNRTVFESELFGMNTYIILSHLEDYVRMPGRMGTIREHMSPADIATTGLPVGTKKNFICLAAMPLHYFAGRELLVDLGDLLLQDDRDEHLAVLKFWREATIAQREDGVLLNIDADPADSSRVMDAAALTGLTEHLEPAGDVIADLRRFGATLTSYCFLENCDSRMAVCDTGPYPGGEGSFIALRELTTDGDGDFRWLDGLRDRLPYHEFVIAYEFPDSVQMMNNIWGTAFFEPSDYLEQTRSARVFVTDNDRLEALDTGELRELGQAIRKVHRELYARFAEMSVRERTLCATQMYAFKLKSWARTAGCYDEIEWDLADQVVDRFEALQDDAHALQLLGGVFVPADRESCFRPVE